MARSATDYLERYQAGAHEQVWAELRALGAAVREEPVLSDARAVAAETMRRARENVALLVERLDTLGYCFTAREHAGARRAWAPATAESRARLALCERMYGTLPLSGYAWHEVVGAVDFTGTHPRLNPRCDPLDANGEAAHAAPLVVFPCAEESIRHVVKDRTRADTALTRARDLTPQSTSHTRGKGEQGQLWQAGETAATRVALAVAPDAGECTGEESGGESAIPLPNMAADAAPAWGAWKGVPFVSYLRICFAWGGFPGLMDADDPPREELAFLRRGLLPL